MIRLDINKHGFRVFDKYGNPRGQFTNFACAAGTVEAFPADRCYVIAPSGRVYDNFSLGQGTAIEDLPA